MKNNTLGAIAMLIGCTIGAGVLGIPYVVAKAGLLTGISVILVIGLMILITHLYLGEIVLSTKGTHQLTGYAEKYLGKEGKMLMYVGMAVSLYGALLAYIIGIGESMNAILPWSSSWYGLIALVFVGTIISQGLSAVERSELLLDFLKIGTLVIIFIIVIFSDRFALNVSGFSLTSVLIPYGVVLFAFGGLMIIPEMKNELRENKKNLKKAIIIGTLIPIIVYILFAVVFTSLNGNVTEVMTIGLGQIFGQKMIILANLFAVLAMSTSFIALSFVLRDIYIYDYNTEKYTAIILVLFVPALIYIIGARNFITVLNVAGAIGMGMQAILILLMFHIVKKKKERNPEYSITEIKPVSFIIALIFIIGALNAVLLAVR